MKVKKNIKEEVIRKVVELNMIANGIPKEKFDEPFKILIIVEGHSAASNIRSNRDSSVVGIIALRGKILNVWQKDLSSANKSIIVKELLQVLEDNVYDKIIITTDADCDGSHIATLIIACIYKFRKDLIKNLKVCNNVSPFYTFSDKNMKLVGWSNDKNDCPKGCTINVNKGLGSFTTDETKRLLLNPSAGAEWELITIDKDSTRMLTVALQEGGRNLFFQDDENNVPQPFAV